MTDSTEMSSTTRPSQTRTPDFFIVGHPKSGTTALYEMLRRHPQIFMPELKETQFFARELHPRAQPSHMHPETLEEYLCLFKSAKPGQRKGEASPSYIRSHFAAARIADLRPDARIIVIFREPASYLRSMHLELLRDHVETETDLRKALDLEMVNRDTAAQSRTYRIERPVYADRVRYVDQLRRYHAVFPPEQVLILIYEDFRRDNEATVRGVLRFLEVDDTSQLEMVDANPTVRVRSPRTYEFVRSLYLGEGTAGRMGKAAIKALTPRRLRRDAHTAIRQRILFGEPRAPDEELMRDLRKRFKPEVIALSEYLRRDVAMLWGYDSIE